MLSDVTSVTPIAVKSLPYIEKNKREAQTLHKLRHPNIVSIFHSDVYNLGPVKHIYIAMELCNTQNLQDHITENRKNNVPFDQQLSISQAKQLVSGLDFIHRNDIIHRDLKPQNVLLSLDKKTLKIADFGISKPMTSGHTMTMVTNARAGTEGYRAPETYNSNEVSRYTDIFSLGLVYYFIWSEGYHPYGDDPDEWSYNIKRNMSPDLSHILVPHENKARKLLKQMLDPEPRQRPTTEDILSCFEQGK